MGNGEPQKKRLGRHRKSRGLDLQLSIANGYCLRLGEAHPKRQQRSSQNSHNAGKQSLLMRASEKASEFKGQG